MIPVEDFYNHLTRNGLDFFTGVPDSLLKDICSYIFQTASREKNIIAANEGNAVGLAVGYHLSTGKAGVVYMQNSGEGNAVNPLLSIADSEVYSIPLLLLIGWRGMPGVHDEPQHVKQGKVTCALLDAMEIPYRVVSETWREDLDTLLSEMWEGSHPVALVVPKGSFTSHSIAFEPEEFELTRESMLETVLSEIGDDFVVSTTGKTSREVFEIREARGEDHSHDFLTVGGMGHASSIAFGMALGTNRNVWCIDGDGSFLMHMGALAATKNLDLPNFKYILNNNGAHESVGGQPTAGREIDIKKILIGSGFDDVLVAETDEDLQTAVRTVRDSVRVALVVNTRQGSRGDLRRPTTTPIENKQAIMDCILEGVRE